MEEKEETIPLPLKKRICGAEVVMMMNCLVLLNDLAIEGVLVFKLN
jgi:hypothetical protein